MRRLFVVDECQRERTCAEPFSQSLARLAREHASSPQKHQVAFQPTKSLCLRGASSRYRARARPNERQLGLALFEKNFGSRSRRLSRSLRCEQKWLSPFELL